jgi:pyruvate dehydrogenase E1 component
VATDVFSVTSFTELRREGMGVSRRKRLGKTGVGPHPREPGSDPAWLESQLPATGAPVVAASDYVAAVADLIRPWIADRYVALGTDGFGRSDTRANLRRFFEVDRHSVALAALAALGDARVGEASSRYGVAPAVAPPWTR